MVFGTYLIKYGKTLILFCAAVYGAGHYLDLTNLKIIAVVLFMYFWYFFRITRFHKRPQVNCIKAPAFGTIQKVQPITLGGKKFIQIATFISVFDTHIQYAPTRGKLVNMQYKEGSFNMANMFQKSNDNERLVYQVKSPVGAIFFSQIAGMLARTIVSFVKEGQSLNQCQEIGLIKLGSRADVFIPYKNNMTIMVKEGDKVKGGQTNMAVYH